MNSDGDEIGRVSGLWRYPVKSMAGEPLTQARIAWQGVEGDRRWAFLRADVPRSGFPWLTIREEPRLAQYRPLLRDPARPDRSDMLVCTPSGAVLDVTDPALATELARGARAIKQDRGIFDALPLSLLSAQSVNAVADVVGRELDIRRFRPNVILDAYSSDKFPEDTWVGATLTIGTARLRIDAPDQRCAVTNVDPDTSHSDPSILRAIAREHQGFLGVYGTTVRPGQIRVGDRVIRYACPA